MEVCENDGHRRSGVYPVFSSREGAVVVGSFFDSGHREFQVDPAVLRHIWDPRISRADSDRNVFKHGALRACHVPGIYHVFDVVGKAPKDEMVVVWCERHVARSEFDLVRDGSVGSVNSLLVSGA